MTWRGGWVAETIFLSRVHCRILWHICKELKKNWYNSFKEVIEDSIIAPTKWRTSIKELNDWLSVNDSKMCTHLAECKCFRKKFSSGKMWLAHLDLLQSSRNRGNWPFDRSACRSKGLHAVGWLLGWHHDCHLSLNWHVDRKYSCDHCPRHYLQKSKQTFVYKKIFRCFTFCIIILILPTLFVSIKIKLWTCQKCLNFEQCFGNVWPNFNFLRIL